MYSIDRQPYGVRLTLTGRIGGEAMQRWLADSCEILPALGEGFGVFVDMRGLNTLDPEAKAAMQEGQRYYRQCGMRRSVVIVDSPMVCAQFKRIAWETGIYEWERYISTAQVPDWEATGIAWLEHATDPDRLAA